MKERSVIQNYEEKRNLVSRFHLTSDLFSSKVLYEFQSLLSNRTFSKVSRASKVLQGAEGRSGNYV